MTSDRGRIAIAALLVVGCVSPEPESTLLEFSGPTMGTRYRVKYLVGALSSSQQQELQTVVTGVLDEVNSKMSHYAQDSEVSRFNRWRGPEPFAVSVETMTVLLHARDISAATEGAFDITVGPLVDAWGFGPPGRPAEAPPDSRIAGLLAITGWEMVELDRDSSTLRKAHPDVSLDLSAIAKGYGVDRVAEILEARDVRNYMVEVGGEVRTGGLNARGEPWRIGIERPLPDERSIELVLPLSGLALATSGDYRNYYEIDGRRISHTIDPRTGQPISHQVASVSVVDALCVRADAFATALLVMGPEGVELAETLGLAAYFLQREKGGVFVGRMTRAFEELLDRARPEAVAGLLGGGIEPSAALLMK